MLRTGNVPDGMTVAEVNAYINYRAGSAASAVCFG